MKLHAARAQKQAGMAVSPSGTADLKPKLVRRYKDGHCTVVKGVTQQEEVRLVNIYALQMGAQDEWTPGSHGVDRNTSLS